MMDTKVKKSMVCVIISGPTLHEAREQVRKASQKAGMLEFRLDQFQFSQPEAIQHLMEASPLPVIFTLRRRAHGGEFSGSADEHLCRVCALAVLQPDYFDLEYDLDKNIFLQVRHLSSKTRLICSYHDFEHTPKELELLLQIMQEKEADIYKIATMTNSALDIMRMMRFLREKTRKGVRLIAIAMGDRGVASRILGAVYGNVHHYSILADALRVAPGQITADSMQGQYNIDRITAETKVLGLIGDPVVHSVSDRTHNCVLHDLGLDAVYVKIPVNNDELHDFLELAKRLDFHGLSVTMPLKEDVLKECSSLTDSCRKIGAVNTLLFQERALLGDNTDAKGALDVVEERFAVAGKHLVIIGAGGTAKAIAYEAHRRGAAVTILNRTIERAAVIAEEVEGAFGSLEDFAAVAKQGYDVLVNCTPFGMVAEWAKVPIDYAAMLPGKLVLDVVVTKQLSPFLVEARAIGCDIVPGIEMFIQQAIEQFVLWFAGEVDREAIVCAFKQISHEEIGGRRC